MRRGINHKRINITIDRETYSILEKYRNWGTPVSALIRKAVQTYDRKKAAPEPMSWDGVDEQP